MFSLLIVGLLLFTLLYIPKNVKAQSAPSIQFVPPTPDHDETITDNYVTVNITSLSEGDHYTFLDWDNSLMGWWRLENLSAIDESGHGNHGTVHGATITDGQFGNALQFDRVAQDYVSIPNPINVSHITISSWIKLDSIDGHMYIVSNSRDYTTPPEGGYDFRVGSHGKLRFGMWRSDARTMHTLTSHSVLEIGQWYHAVATFDGSYMKIYINNELDRELFIGTSITIIDAPYNLTIGCLAPGAPQWYHMNGTIDEVLIFNRSLSTSELGLLHNTTQHYYANFTYLPNDTYTYQGHSVGEDGEKNSTEERSITINTPHSLINIPKRIIDDRPIYEDTILCSTGITNNMTIRTCAGEYIAATFVVNSETPLNDLNITTTNLMGSDSSISSDNIDIYLVKKWYQRSTNRVGHEFRRIYIPELLIKDDELVRVEYINLTAGWNKLRTLEDGYIEINNNTDPEHLYHTVKDSDVLQSISLGANENIQYWVILYVPEETLSDTYEGFINITEAGSPIGTINLSVEVLPFTLPDSDIIISLYYGSRLLPSGNSSLGRAAEVGRSVEQIEAEMNLMRQQGITHPIVYQSLGTDETRFATYMEIRNNSGMEFNPFYYLGTSFKNITTEDTVKTTTTNLIDWLSANYSTEDVYMYFADESSMTDKSDQVNWTREVGGLSYNAQFPHQAWEAIEHVPPLLDLFIVDCRNLNKSLVEAIHNEDKLMGAYHIPQVGSEVPLIYRRNYGLLLWQDEIDVSSAFALQWGGRNLWNDWGWDTQNYKQHMFCYPTTNSTVNTIQFEGFREGVNDIRYINKLEELIETGDSMGLDVSDAESYVTTLKSDDLTTRDLTNTRNDVIDYIILLDNCINEVKITNPDPPHQSTDVSVNIAHTSVTIEQPQGNPFNYTIQGSFLNNIGQDGATNNTFNVNIPSTLQHGTAYTWYVNATYSTYTVNEVFTFTTQHLPPSVPTSFTSTTHSHNQINLSWTPGTNATHTYIEWRDTAPWNRGDGNEIYNDTGTFHAHINLDSNTTYYYQTWSYNETTNLWSTTYGTTSNTTLSPPATTEIIRITYQVDISNVHGVGTTVQTFLGALMILGAILLIVGLLYKTELLGGGSG